MKICTFRLTASKTHSKTHKKQCNLAKSTRKTKDTKKQREREAMTQLFNNYAQSCDSILKVAMRQVMIQSFKITMRKVMTHLLNNYAQNYDSVLENNYTQSDDSIFKNNYA